ncbi:MAG: hypothetical protein ACD_77C00498G0001 [uncultured bacterium]|nr:MAG: hypothetical protein ACD_77C00498G0001 [uncultured bacterium]
MMKSKKEILDERAKKNSQNNLVRCDTTDHTVSLIEFRILPETYAIEEKYVSEVLSLRNLTEIPGTPSYLLGVINFRGKILSVLNLQIFLNKKEKGLAELNKLVVISDGKMEYGIVSDGIFGQKNVDIKSIGSKPTNLDSSMEEFISGILPDGVILLDGSSLLNTSKIIIK